MLWSVWYEFDLLPYVPFFSTYLSFCSTKEPLSETAKRWSPEDGVWLAPWMRYQIFIPLLLLKFLNIFWYFLICRIAVRCVLRDLLALFTFSGYINPLGPSLGLT